jgi:hypothetical protein
MVLIFLVIGSLLIVSTLKLCGYGDKSGTKKPKPVTDELYLRMSGVGDASVENRK